MEPYAFDACPVDHDSINSRHRVHDTGGGWDPCPMCGTKIEPKMALGRYPGPDIDKGRGDLTKLQRERLSNVTRRMKFWDWMRANRPDGAPSGEEPSGH